MANRLIAALPAALRGALLGQAELVELALHARLLGVGEPLKQLWFPLEGFVSVLQPVPGSASVPLALVGHEGMLDVPLLLARQPGRVSRQCWRVQAAGQAFRLPLAALATRPGNAAWLELLRAYAALRYEQQAQQLVCLSQHSVAQRLARCLLMARDRAQVPELFLTHEGLAQMLGARRESVTQAARQLQQRGLISYSRGYLMLLDQPGLHAQACACYDADREAAASALPAAEAPAGAAWPVSPGFAAGAPVLLG